MRGSTLCGLVQKFKHFGRKSFRLEPNNTSLKPDTFVNVLGVTLNRANEFQ